VRGVKQSDGPAPAGPVTCGRRLLRLRRAWAWNVTFRTMPDVRFGSKADARRCQLSAKSGLIDRAPPETCTFVYCFKEAAS